MSLLSAIPTNWLIAAGCAALALAWQFRGEIGTLLRGLNPLGKSDAKVSSREALELALKLKDHFPPNSVGRAAIRQVIEAITTELVA